MTSKEVLKMNKTTMKSEGRIVELSRSVIEQLVERDTPKKVIVSRSEFLEPPEFVCSVCKEALHISFTFCPYCGQRITYNDY